MAGYTIIVATSKSQGLANNSQIQQAACFCKQSFIGTQLGEMLFKDGNKDTDLLENGLEDMGRGWGEM